MLRMYKVHTRRTREKEEREGRSHCRRKKSAGSQIAMKPGTDASRGFHITTGPPMVVLPISFASSTDTHPSIDPDALANSCLQGVACTHEKWIDDRRRRGQVRKMMMITDRSKLKVRGTLWEVRSVIEIILDIICDTKA